MTTNEERSRLLRLPLREQRAALKKLNLPCEVCLQRPAKRVLRGSLVLCCVMRADRCPARGTPPGAICYGCGIPAVQLMRSGWVCGTEKNYGCAELARRIYEQATAKRQLIYDDPDAHAALEFKRQATCMERYGATSSMACPEIRAKISQACSDHYGVANPSHSEELKEKVRATNRERFGVDYPAQLPENRNRVVEAQIRRFGASSCVSSPDWREGYRERTGEDHPMKHQEHRDAQQAVFLERYGGRPAQDAMIRAQMTATCIRRYGTVHGLTPEVLAARVLTNITRFGCSNPMFNDRVLRTRWLPRLYRLQNITLPSGRTIQFQGYELPPLQEYLHEFGEDDMLFNGDLIITLPGDRRYIPDFAVKSIKLLVEIKSDYTFEKAMKGNLLLKFKEATTQGWTPIVEVWGRQGGSPDLQLLRRLTYQDLLPLKGRGAA